MALAEHTDARGEDDDGACVEVFDCGCDVSETTKLGLVPSVDTRVSESSLLRLFVDAS